MLQVDWSQAPEWANWWSHDVVGGAWWAERPIWSESSVAFTGIHGRCLIADHFGAGRHGNYLIAKEHRPASGTAVAGLPDTDPNASSEIPSKEFPWTWIEFGSYAHWGPFFRSRDAAERDGRNNYHNFEGGAADRTVYVTKVEGLLNDGSKGSS